MNVSITIQAQVPAGTSLDYRGSTIPFGFLAEDGSVISRVTYARLFEAIGTTYGAGDGSTTFKLPDSRGRANIGSGTGSGLSARTLGAVGGEETHLLTESEIPSHTHTQNAHNHGVTDPGHSHTVLIYSQNSPEGSGGKLYNNGDPYTPSPASTNSVTTGVSVNNATATNQNTGGGTSHNNMQPFLVATKIIKF